MMLASPLDGIGVLDAAIVAVLGYAVVVEAADPDDNEYGDHNDNSEDNTNSSELTLPDEDYNIDQDDKPETDEFTIN